VIVRPLLDFALVAIGPTIGVWTIAIAFLKPLLVLALQLVVEAHSVDLQAARVESGGFALVGAIDLSVVFQLAFAFQTGIEGLTVVPVAVTIRFQ
jgi:hypothetical protein